MINDEKQHAFDSMSQTFLALLRTLEKQVGIFRKSQLKSFLFHWPLIKAILTLLMLCSSFLDPNSILFHIFGVALMLRGCYPIITTQMLWQMPRKTFFCSLLLTQQFFSFTLHFHSFLFSWVEAFVVERKFSLRVSRSAWRPSPNKSA